LIENDKNRVVFLKTWYFLRTYAIVYRKCTYFFKNMATNTSYQESELQKKLRKSPTALGSGTTPTKIDLATQRKLLTLQKRDAAAEDQAIKDKWYADEQSLSKKKKDLGPSALAPRTEPKGIISSALEAAQIPLNVIAGTAEWALGKGTKKGLYENITSNIDEHGTFGDILRQYGTGDPLSLVGGMALDIALDPVNWATMGSSAFVPRIALGAKAGAKGVGLGAKSVGLDIVRTLTKPVDWVLDTKVAAEAAAKGAAEDVALGITKTPKINKAAKITTTIADKVRNVRSGIVGEAIKTRDLYDTATGQTIENILKNGYWGQKALDAVAGKGADYINPKTKSWFEEYFNYSPQKWMAEQIEKGKKLNEDLAKVGGSTLRERAMNLSERQMVKQKVLNESNDLYNQLERSSAESTANKFLDDLKAQGFDYTSEKERVASELRALSEGRTSFEKTKAANDSMSALDEMVAAAGDKVFDHNEFADALRREHMDDLVMKYRIDTLKKAGIDETEMKGFIRAAREAGRATGVKWFDDGMNKFSKAWIIKDKLKGERVMKGYQSFIDLFKGTKIGSLSSTSLALLSNAAMTQMYGINVYNTALQKELLSAISASLKSMRTPGGSVTLSELLGVPEIKKFAETYPEIFRKSFGVDPLDILSNQSAFDVSFSQFLKSTGSEAATKAEMRAAKRQYVNAARKAGALVADVVDTTSVREELRLTDSYWKDVINWSKQNPDKKIAKFIEWTYNKPLELFDITDRSYKMGLAAHLVKNGLSNDEIILVNRFNKLNIGTKSGDGLISGGDIARDLKTGKWMFSGEKAVDIANDVYMNYAAMPKAIKVLRNLPVVGMPFASFAYAMLTKTGQTALYNPAIFNKVQFLFNEINGGRTPVEKEALNTPYYTWLKKNGMVSLPFFRDNPVYMNLANFFPYYSMNIFQPSERRTEQTVGGNIVKIIDSMPLLKTPEGQLLMDYIIVPSLLTKAAPTGIFDQPLYPNGATNAEKVGYFGRSLAETVLPNNLAAIAGPLLPDPVLNYAPYKWRRVAYAARGKRPTGDRSSEPRLNMLFRAMMSAYAGIGIYPVNIKYNN
jgi:hypothetical protein